MYFFPTEMLPVFRGKVNVSLANYILRSDALLLQCNELSKRVGRDSAVSAVLTVRGLNPGGSKICRTRPD